MNGILTIATLSKHGKNSIQYSANGHCAASHLSDTTLHKDMTVHENHEGAKLLIID